MTTAESLPQPKTETEADALAKAVEQLYGNERLTDMLTDEAAQQLLAWGEQQLKYLATAALPPAEFEQAGHDLQQMIRSINRLVGERTDLTELVFTQRLLDLVEQAKKFHTQFSMKEQVTTDDQEAQAEQ